ncbi:pentatricopeptide repeat-containing protein At3g50420 [Magnolia sinica]|uniref:pentatricopeptide repeat-containing protein At3g50420 n=1 Tax=Magnolia sinica TaxID=86752 RepID=UPI00265AD02E|nr:pentatricopeptide repeat-containing protein At3g50420 [Magnolia sinica]
MASVETYSMSALIQKCTSTNSLRKARQLHALILTATTVISPPPFLNNNLLSMYAKSNSIEDARRVFDKMPSRNPVSYNALIAAYSRIPGQAVSALRLFQLMAMEGLSPSSSTFTSLLQASSSIEDHSYGCGVHTQVIKLGFFNDLPVQTSLLGMYSNCGDSASADMVFSMMIERDAVAWNSMIFGNVRNGWIERGLQLFCSMVRAGSVPTHFTFSIALNACSRLGDQISGRIIHSRIIKSEYPADTPLQNALIDMYSSCGDSETAFSVFRMIETPDLVSWNSMIAGYSENGDGEKAMELFVRSRHSSLENPDEYTFAAIVSATGALAALNYGKPLHAHIKKAGFEHSVFVVSTLINMYFKIGETGSARKLFNSMLERDAILWTEMISGHSRLGEGEIAVEHFCGMLEEGHKVDSFSLSSVLSSAADLAALTQGEMIHSLVVKTGHEADMCVCGSLVDMYAKNGYLKAAHLGFSRVTKPDLKCWNSMLGGYGHHGNAEQAFELFDEMEKQGLRPDRVTFISLLSACSHCGLVEKGTFYWNYMKENNIAPGLKHYSCMVSLLSRAGLLRVAEDLIKESPFHDDFPELWRILLSSCIINKELEMGVHAAERVLRYEPEDTATHILLLNLYAAAGRWDAVAEMRRKVRGLATEKDPGLSWIEVRNEIHVFSAGDESHPQVGDARAEIQQLQENIRGWEISNMI